MYNTLTISQVIEALEDTLNKKGDIPLYVSTNSDNNTVTEIEEIHCIRVKNGAAVLMHSDEELDLKEVQETYEDEEEDSDGYSDVEDFFEEDDQ